MKIGYYSLILLEIRNSMRTMLRSILILLFLVQGSVYGQQDILSIRPSNSAPTIDGIVDLNEWDEAVTVELVRAEDWKIKVLATYDPEYLYIAFCNVQSSDKVNLNAEVLVQTVAGMPDWDDNTYWFHASYGNCMAQGEYYNWEHCSNYPEGWKANTYPLNAGSPNFEFKIRFTTLQMRPPIPGTKLGIALKLSSPTEVKTYWPNDATIEDPGSWGTFIFE